MGSSFPVYCFHLLAACHLLFAVSASSPSQGKKLPYMTSDVKEVSGKSFGYIIVGGGAAGCPLAATLSEKFLVLLVERGDSPYENPLVMEKRSYRFSLIQTDEFSSVAQAFVSEEGVLSHRGRVLGGSTAINSGFYSRASREYIRKAGWDEELVRDSYEWIESKLVSTPDVLTPWQNAAKFAFVEAGIRPFNGCSLEHIEGTKVGGTIFDENGRRHTAADLLEAANPENIVVLLNATVKNVILDKGDDNSKHIVHGVRFIRSNNSTGEFYEAYIKRSPKSNPPGDVILSAGALGSPQILLLSGVGPQEHLKSLNISPEINLEGVGRKMKDNPCIGLFADQRLENRLPDPPQIVGISDKFIVQTTIMPVTENTTVVPIVAKYAFVASEGELKLQNTDPRKNPSVRFNYFSNEEDLRECANMVQLIQEVSKTESVTMFWDVKRNESEAVSHDELVRFCKQNVRTYYHYHGGCVVGSVVDEDYRVYGVKGLRVVDGSTLSESPGTNPMATLLMLGRYQGIKMVEERKHDSASNENQPEHTIEL